MASIPKVEIDAASVHLIWHHGHHRFAGVCASDWADVGSENSHEPQAISRGGRGYAALFN